MKECRVYLVFLLTLRVSPQTTNSITMAMAIFYIQTVFDY